MSKFNIEDIGNKCSFRRKKCSNCAFLIRTSTNTGNQSKVDENTRLQINTNKSTMTVNRAFHRECYHDMWINKGDDIQFLRKYKCIRFVSFAKYPFATFPSLEKILKERNDSYKWQIVSLTALFSAIAAGVSANLHIVFTDFIAKIFLYISQL